MAILNTVKIYLYTLKTPTHFSDTCMQIISTVKVSFFKLN